MPRFWPAFLAICVCASGGLALHAQAMNAIEKVETEAQTAYEAEKKERIDNANTILLELTRQNQLLTDVQSDVAFIRGILEGEKR